MDDSKRPPRRGGNRKPKSQRRHDWKKARRLYEIDGKTFTEIGETIGAGRDTVAAHAKTEGWVNPAKILRETADERREKLVAGFIAQESASISELQREKAGLNRRILALAGQHLQRLEDGREFQIDTGRRTHEGDPVLVDEDPIASLRRLSLVVQTVEVVDRSLADLKNHDWRAGATGSGALSESDQAAVRAVLAEAERPESAGPGSASHESALPD